MVEYYQPLTAWHDYGYTSYVYGTLYGQSDLFRRYMDRVLRTHNPELFVVDLRMLVTLDETEISEQGVRFWTDSLPVLSMDRYLSLYDYFKGHADAQIEDKASYYFDIAKYHTNLAALKAPENWMYINNKGHSQYKGYEMSSEHSFFAKPFVDGQNRTELTQMQSTVLYQILDYSKDKNLNVLFVVCPYMVTEEEQSIYNTVKDIVASYGYRFINANEYYDEIGLDFSVGMKNVNHVNCIGAEEYTRFLAKYIVENYNIPRHKGDARYQPWEESYTDFAEELGKAKENIYQTIENKRQAIELADCLKKSENIYEWSTGARNENYTVIVCTKSNGFRRNNATAKVKQLLDSWGIWETGENPYLYISCGGETIFLEKKKGIIDYQGRLGVIDGSGQMPCEVYIDDEIIRIAIGDEEYAGETGMRMILVDNNFKRVVDNISLTVDSDGTIRMDRQG